MAEGGAADLETQRSDVAALLKTALRKGDTCSSFSVRSNFYRIKDFGMLLQLFPAKPTPCPPSTCIWNTGLYRRHKDSKSALPALTHFCSAVSTNVVCTALEKPMSRPGAESASPSLPAPRKAWPYVLGSSSWSAHHSLGCTTHPCNGLKGHIDELWLHLLPHVRP